MEVRGKVDKPDDSVRILILCVRRESESKGIWFALRFCLYLPTILGNENLKT